MSLLLWIIAKRRDTDNFTPEVLAKISERHHIKMEPERLDVRGNSLPLTSPASWATSFESL